MFLHQPISLCLFVWLWSLYRLNRPHWGFKIFKMKSDWLNHSQYIIFIIIFLQLLSTAASLFQISFTVPPNKSAPFIGFPKNGMITYGGTRLWFTRVEMLWVWFLVWFGKALRIFALWGWWTRARNRKCPVVKTHQAAGLMLSSSYSSSSPLFKPDKQNNQCKVITSTVIWEDNLV